MIATRLQALRRRWMAQAFCRAFAWAMLAAMTGAVGLLPALPPGGSGAALLWLCGAALAGAGLWTLWQRPTLAAIAADVDRRADTRDRLATALAFTGSPDPLHRAAVAECENALARFHLEQSLPWKLPRALPWMGLPLAALACMAFLPGGAGKPASVPDAATLAIASQLESLARRATQTTKDSPAQALAEALRKSAHRLRTEAAGPEARREMLRELSALEALARATQGETPMDTMTEAFSGQEGALGDAVRQHDAEAAARALENHASTPGAMDDPALRQALERLARGKGGDNTASPAGKAAARALEAMKEGDAEAAREALRQVAHAMREGAGQNPGKNLAQALQELKNGGNPPTGDFQPGQEENGDPQHPGGIAMVEPGSGPPTAESPAIPSRGEEGALPSGNPGTEHDEGSKSSPLGEATEPPGHEAMQTRLHGLLGEGETLHTFIPTRAGEPKASAAYQAIYRSATPAAEAALENESIPLGSRFLIRRYFEAIRP